MDNIENELTKLTTGGVVFNYACPKQTNSCVRRVIELKERIDFKTMEHAMELTRRRYPQLSLALVKTRKGVYVKFHDVPFKLNSLDRGFHYMGEDTGGHLIAFFIRDTLLIIDFFHAIADDAGMDRFIQSLLYNYLTLRGYELENPDDSIATLATNFVPEEGEDPSPEILAKEGGESDWSSPEKAYSIKGRRRGQEEPDYSYTISFPLDEFMAVVKANGATPTTVMSTLFGRVLYRRYSSGTLGSRKPITAEVAVNLRNHFPTQTVRCFTGNVYLSYSEEDDERNLGEVFSDQTADIKKQNTVDGMVDCYKHAMTLADKTFNFDVAPCVKNWIHKHIATRAMSQGMTYGISNIGKTQLPECLKPYVVDYYSQIPSALHAYLISMRSKDNKMTICITTKLKDSPFAVSQLITELKSLGVNAHLENCGDFYFTRYIQNRAVISRPNKRARSNWVQTRTKPYESENDQAPDSDGLPPRAKGAVNES